MASLTKPVARELDPVLLGILEEACGLKIPCGGEEGGLYLRVPAVPGMDRRFFQGLAVRLPASGAWRRLSHAQPVFARTRVARDLVLDHLVRI